MIPEHISIIISKNFLRADNIASNYNTNCNTYVLVVSLTLFLVAV